MDNVTIYSPPQTEMSATSLLKLFETTKEQRESFCMDLVSKIDGGYANPLEVHLQIKCLESIIKLLNDNKNYKDAVLEAAQKQGAKSFEFHNAKMELKEVGTKYTWDNCGDPLLDELLAKQEELNKEVKARQDMLKTVSPKGLYIMVGDELVKVFPPAKQSTSSIAVTLR